MPYSTGRLLIRPPEPADEDLCVALWTDPEVTRYVGGPRDEAVVRDAFRKGLPREWTVVERASGRAVGEVFLLDKEVEGRGEVELNYFFLPDVWGLGYATEACGPVVADAGRLIAIIHPENAPSRRVAEKLGFEKGRRIERPGGPRDLYRRDSLPR
jgi:RimJ/RimL family protein N-acetyltransferase